eukprot:TRINITY_DN7504_c0_g1_i1.p1 TRINITY_DN7504_c0_g1~~TRINITY_DN7504_c0_g1_i1.p1  ORF type:complete len:251 (-),score=60.92 TRINITY_DN7504_c0_g1_i1:129-842(-)
MSSSSNKQPGQNELGQLIGFPLPNWKPAQHPPRTPMTGKYCVIEPTDVSRHSEALFQAFELDRSGWTYLRYGPFDKLSDFQEWLTNVSTLQDPLFFTVLDAKTMSPVGLASYLRIQPEHGVIEVGHLHFSKHLRRSAAATESMYLMMYRAFEELGYRRYEWKCDSLNEPSRQAAQRLGFTYEGRFRQDVVVKGRSRDTDWFSIVDHEWPNLKRKFEGWLAEQNFDQNGQQKQPLNAF